MPKYTYEDVVAALQSAGLKKDEDVFIHSNLGFFGAMEDAVNPQQLCAAFVKAICGIIGPKGTLLVPTFTYSFCHNEVFDAAETPTACGMLPEYVRSLPESRRSGDPNFSIAALGGRAEKYTKTWCHEAFGANSYWQTMLEQKARIMCMNFDCGSTFVHFVERQNNVAYRYDKAFNGVLRTPQGMQRDYAVHFVYDGQADGPNFSRLDALVKAQPFCQKATLGRGSILSFPVVEYEKLIRETLRTRPRFLTNEE